MTTGCNRTAFHNSKSDNDKSSHTSTSQDSKTSLDNITSQDDNLSQHVTSQANDNNSIFDNFESDNWASAPGDIEYI